MNKLKIWLRRYLGITKLETDVNYRLDNIDKLVQVGIDYHLKEESWAVICIAGKAEYVQFVRLSNNEARELLHILSDMKNRGWTYKIDAPQFIHDDIKHYLGGK